MLPSLLTRDIRTGLKQFLVTGFDPSDTFLHGLMQRFVDDESAWLKGPYVQISLPFTPGQHGTRFFADFQTENPAYRHQEHAWQRLSTRHDAANTLVATGTGSGKTECFLYPVLDHCARTRAAGKAGIKALIIYPMNALASDQARRMAHLIAHEPFFAALQVGLYVGGRSEPGKGLAMTPEQVITDRDTLRRQPPDILLTNYKMLDYLMLRPQDRELWASNTPTTLRYVVVDELHTFDGAQGTDLALLLRRLRARLRVPDHQLICVGTSATLGSSADSEPLRDYARQVFGEPFPAGCVITEHRQAVGTFLEDATVDHVLPFRADMAEALDPERYGSPAATVAAWYRLFFAGEPAPGDVADTGWRVQLGQQLKHHQLFTNLLKLLRNGVVDKDELARAFARSLPSATLPQIHQVLDALLVLTAWARGPGGTPLINLRMQLWVRELRRMVGKLATQPAEVMLRSERDLPAQRDGVYLPMVQCRQCRTTGWLSRLVPGTNKLSTQLDEIYNTWFAGRPEAARFYAASSLGRSQVEGIREHACVACGNLQQGPGPCSACGHAELLAIFRVIATRSGSRGNAQFAWHDNTCPACGARDELLLLGARNATLGSQVVEASWASVFNDDKKLIAFSDSVQDAAHRAGFFGARTYLNNVRTALAHVMDEVAGTPLPWSQFLDQMQAQFSQTGSVLHLPDERLVAEFIGPNMAWQHDWAVELCQRGRLPAHSHLPARVRKRLLWQAFCEMTYLSQRGRTLERTGKATLSVPWRVLTPIADALTQLLQESYGLRGAQPIAVGRWLWGLLTHLRRRGGVMHPELATYAADGNVYALTRTAGRNEWLPRMGAQTPHPVFLTLGGQRDFDVLARHNRSTWYERWTEAVLGQQNLLAQGLPADLCMAAVQALEAAHVLIRSRHHLGDTLALSPDVLVLDTRVAFVAHASSKRRLAVPRSEAGIFLGMPCLDAPEVCYDVQLPAGGWWSTRYSQADVRRVIAAEHTGLLDRTEREALEQRFKDPRPRPWYENLLSATPTLEMGVDIGQLSSVLLCSVPPAQASFLQRIGRAGRRDGNAVATTLADGNSPHDLYFFSETREMMAGEVTPPGIFLQAAEVLRRQLFAFCMDDWVAGLSRPQALPHKTSAALDTVEQARQDRFPYTLCEHILVHEQRLFDAFMALLGADATERVRERLRDALQGRDTEGGLRTRLLKTLEGLVQERRTYKKQAEELARARNRLRQKPQDEATRDELDALQRERDTLLGLIREINGRDLLNTLTDAGLIPNYAFPEAGIELKSLLWRKRGADEPGHGTYVTLKALRYERPAQSALSEFAPDNRFYANQRRVEVNQINMQLARAEHWRLCPSCHHMQHLERDPVEHPICPRCGDAMWADSAQKRTLLRFRQAIASSNDAEVRIDDAAEDREPRYYVRQLMADFVPKDIREAWRLPVGDLPFGFEFIARVTFRDINFGEVARPGETFKVADQEVARPGFCLCRHCGMVQKTRQRGSDEAPQQVHSLDCPSHGKNGPGDLFHCLYLYREFESEALRILVPQTRHGIDDRTIQSFMAALQLGLKKRFGGRVDHLRMTLQDEPGQDGAARKHYVLLYDSVPGGTGYLHQLLAQDAGTLSEVLGMALQALQECGCNQDPEKDGCYRCLYQYRLGRHMEQVSRDTAKATLGELVKSLGALERVDTIADIALNPNFDSVLEARFIEALKRLGAVRGLPTVRLHTDIVAGKNGYVLEVDAQRYRVEPQCELGPEQGVSVRSKPDFVIWPWATRSARLPLAIFCDGWAYHKDKTRDDALKRSAIAASGRFLVWSVTHQDVAAALDGRVNAELESPLRALVRHDAGQAPASIPRPISEQPFEEHEMVRLVRLLAGKAGTSPAQWLWTLQRDALWAAFLLVPVTAGDRHAAENDLQSWKALLPRELLEPTGTLASCSHAPCIARPGVPWLQLGRWPLACARGQADMGNQQAPGVVILDESAAHDEESMHRAWRQWLRLYNLMQVLPGMRLATMAGLRAHDHDELEPADRAADTPAPSDDRTTLEQAWLAVLEEAIVDIQPGLAVLARAGAAIPEVGAELAGEEGTVTADSELAWPDPQTVLLRPDQADLAMLWRAAGWATLVLDDDLSCVDGQKWERVAARHLNLDLPPQE